MKKILLSAGGTAGHVFPAIAIYEQLKLNNIESEIITDIRGVKYLKNEKHQILQIKKFGLKFFLISPILFFKSLFLMVKCDTLICFGGYTSFFPFLAAFLLRKKRIVFQLDSKVTRLNKILIPFASKIFYVFPQTIIRNKNKIEIGMPLKKKFAFSFINHSANFTIDNFIITITGGSLGSQFWETEVLQALQSIPSEIAKKITLIIQTKKLPEKIAEQFKGILLKEILIYEFLDTAEVFKKSHLIIGRAGASTISEISCIGRPCYLFPWEKAVDNHQYHNASIYCKLSASKFHETDDNPEILKEYIIKLYNDEKYFHYLCEKSVKALKRFEFSEFLKNL